MSQAGELNVVNNHPTIPTSFVTNSGTAVPIANEIEILGAHVAASGSPVATTGVSNIVTINVQASSAQASSSATNLGLASFNSSEFSVDANGYVTLTGSSALSFATDSGTATPSMNTITFTGDTTGLTFSGASSTVTLGGDLNVAHGGTGDTSFTAYAPICGGTTTTGALQSASTGIATSGFVLTSNGSSALPSFQAASASGAITTIDGNSGSATPTAGVVTIKTPSSSGDGTAVFTGSGSTLTLTFTMGSGENVGIGTNALSSITSGSANCAFGWEALANCSSGLENSAFGEGALNELQTSNGNTAVGQSALFSLKTGADNIAIGLGAAGSYTSSESSNIIIGNVGTVSESNVIRIGTQGSGGGQQNACYIAGIEGVSVSNLNYVTINTSTGQLGSTAILNTTWTDEAVSFNALAGNGYFITAGSVIATLPGSPSQGNTISFTVDTTSSFEILANTGQVIRIGSAVSASAGNAVNNARGDSVTLIYRAADTAWIAKDVIGTWTVT